MWVVTVEVLGTYGIAMVGTRWSHITDAQQFIYQRFNVGYVVPRTLVEEIRRYVT